MAGRHQRVPDFLAWRAYKNQEKGIHEIERDQAPDTGMDCEEQWQVSYSRRRKNSEILEKYRKLHEGYSDRVGDCADVDPL